VSTPPTAANRPGSAGRGEAAEIEARRGVVTLTIGDTGRTSRSRARSRPASGPGAGGDAKGKGQDAGGATQRGWHWSDDGPGAQLSAPPPEPDLALALSPDDARLVGRGELEPSVAFMQGRLKTSGDNALLLRVLAWTATPAFTPARAEWSGEPAEDGGAEGS
jgi:SCP-2 sterol transfer family